MSRSGGVVLDRLGEFWGRFWERLEVRDGDGVGVCFGFGWVIFSCGGRD